MTSFLVSSSYRVVFTGSISRGPFADMSEQTNRCSGSMPSLGLPVPFSAQETRSMLRRGASLFDALGERALALPCVLQLGTTRRLTNSCDFIPHRLDLEAELAISGKYSFIGYIATTSKESAKRRCCPRTTLASAPPVCLVLTKSPAPVRTA